MILVSGISLPFLEPPEHAAQRAAKLLRLTSEQSRGFKVVKRAVDCRRPDRIQFVYTIGFSLPGEEKIADAVKDSRVTIRKPPEPFAPSGTVPLEHRPVVAGFGPAGMFCALLLARHGYRPLVLERGADIEERSAAVERFWKTGALDPECNVQFGEGGAGAFSDGKLTTRIGDPRCEWAIQELLRFGAPPEIGWQAKPHIGTDRLRGVVRALREEIVRLGGEIRFRCRMDGLALRNGALSGVETSCGILPAQVLVVALGHSARDSFRMLSRCGAEMIPKTFSVGVRVEHLREEVNRALFGRFAGHPLLPEAEYQLSYRENNRGVYTFCMCPGGTVVPAASENGGVVVNGMSEFLRNGRNSNSALVCNVGPDDFGEDPLDGVRFQERLEQAAFQMGGGGFAAPVQTVGKFLDGKPGAAFGRVEPSYALPVTEADFSELFPEAVLKLLKTGLRRFGSRQKGFDAPDTVLTGAESRTSSPLRILRGENLQCRIAGVYPCGEGAGYAGGILSAAADGLRAAEAILSEYRPLD